MFEWLSVFLGQNDLLPHGFCIKWFPLLLSAYVISDSLIALAYLFISLALIYFSRNRQYPMFSNLLWLFAAFIFACGATHLMAIFTIWKPYYWVEIGVLAITAVLSMVTVVYLVPMIPKLQRLEYQSKQYEAIIRTSDDAIISKTTDGIVTSWNFGAEAIFGYSAEEMIGKTMLILLPADRQDEEKLILERIKHGEKVDHFGTVRLRKDGSPIHVSVTISPILDSRGRVIGASKIARDITEQMRSVELIWHRANFDQLTDLPNRSLFFDRLSKALSQARRSGKRVALFYLDLDGFKPINDYHGHEAGDIVLKTVARRWLECVREADTIARMGGDEFTVILGELEVADEAAAIAEKLIQVLDNQILLPDMHGCRVGASVGIAIFPDNATEMDSMLVAADAAMYQSKKHGKNTYTYSDAKPDKNDPNDWIVFDDSHLIGVAEIDDQHRRLVRLVNQMNRVLVKPDNEANTKALFDELIQFTQFHFETEQRLMEQYDYPGKDAHVSEHKLLLDDLQHQLTHAHLGTEILTLQTIKSWLLGHIRTADMALGVFLKARGG